MCSAHSPFDEACKAQFSQFAGYSQRIGTFSSEQHSIHNGHVSSCLGAYQPLQHITKYGIAVDEHVLSYNSLSGLFSPIGRVECSENKAA